MLELRDVVKSYDSVAAVRGLSFRAEPGEIFGLIGPNGAGKSTTIRMVMNIIAPDSGEVRFQGSPLREADKARIGYLPEERGLYKKVKVGEMLRYLAELKGVRRKAADSSIDEWLARFGLEEWKDRKVEELSKGMAQKVQFIGTVVHDPELLLFDEPFSGLDPISQDLLLDAMLDLKKRGKTVLFSTHIMEHAEKICERILLLHKGSALASGSVSEIKAGEGRESVHLEFDGDASFLESLPAVERASLFPRSMELLLRPGADPDLIFRAAAGRLRVRSFVVTAPSLHSVFVSLVGGAQGSATQPASTEEIPHA